MDGASGCPQLMGAAACEGWANMPVDLLALVGDMLDLLSYSRLFLVCKGWCKSLRQHMQHLSPSCLGPPWQGLPFQSVRTIAAPLARTKLEGFTYHMPLVSSSQLMAAWFPALNKLDLSGQVLGTGVQSEAGSAPGPATLQALQQCTTLQALDFSCSTLSAPDLADLLRGLLNLRTLLLAGVTFTGSASSSEQALVLDSLRTLPCLSCLDLSLSAPDPPADQHGIVLTGRASQLLPLVHLTSLTLHHQRLHMPDLDALGQMSGLHNLGFDLCGADANGQIGPTSAVLQPLVQLRGLTSLRTVMYGRRGLYRRQTLRLAPMPNLQRLALSGCCDAGLLLSACSMPLRVLDVSRAWLDVTAELVVQVCSCLPQLTALDVSYSMWGVGPMVYGQFKLPGDVLLAGLAAVAPQLRTLRMLGVPCHGTGFCPSRNSPMPGLALLQDLAMPVSLLLRSKVRDVGGLLHLRRLTLTDMLPGEFLAATQVGAFQPLTSLAGLTALRITAPRSAPRNAPGPAQPGAVPADVGMAIDDAEPVEDGWLPADEAAHAMLGAGAAGQLQGMPPGQQQGQGQGQALEIAAVMANVGNVLEQLAVAQPMFEQQGNMVHAQWVAQEAMHLQQLVHMLQEMLQQQVPQQLLTIVAQSADAMAQALAVLQGQGAEGGAAAGAGAGEQLGAGAGGVNGAVEPMAGVQQGAAGAAPLALALEQAVSSDEEGSSASDSSSQGHSASSGSEHDGSSGSGSSEEEDDDSDWDMSDLVAGFAGAGSSSGGGGGGGGLGRRSMPRPEPHLHFAGALLQLQVLVLNCLSTSGLCLRHLSTLSSLRILSMGGTFDLTPAGMAAIRTLRLPRLASLQLLTCTYDQLVANRGAGTGAPPLRSAGDRLRALRGRGRGRGRGMPMLQARPGRAGGASSSRSAVAAGSTGAGAESQPAAGSGVQQLLTALTQALPQLQHLELGDCPGLTEDTLQQAVRRLPQLRYLVLHGQPMPLGRCKAALDGLLDGGGGGGEGSTSSSGVAAGAAPGPTTCELRYFASWQRSATAQVAAGAVHVPGGGPLGGGSSGGGGPWPGGLDMAADQAHGMQLPGDGFFHECPPRTADLKGPQRHGAFMLVRRGAAMLPSPPAA